jgi:RNA polymerase sigma-70 factor (ECF subfamily)
VKGVRPQLPEPSSERAERFRALYAAGYLDVLRFVQRRVHPTHAEDVVAEAFLVVWRRIDELPARPSDQRAWLFGIARNCLLNARRGAHRAEALAVRLADAECSGSAPRHTDCGCYEPDVRCAPDSTRPRLRRI